MLPDGGAFGAQGLTLPGVRYDAAPSRDIDARDQKAERWINIGLSLLGLLVVAFLVYYFAAASG